MFISSANVSAIYLAIGPVDFRKGIFGLCALIDQDFTKDNKKNLFVFTNRTRKRIRIIYWDDTGHAMWVKVLEKDRFKWPKRETELVELTTETLKWLLRGADIDAIKTHKKTKAKAFF